MENKIKKNNAAQTESIARPLGEPTPQNTNNKNLGVVENCGQLRIRKEPDKEADVIAIIPVGTIIELLDNDVINGFYAIRTKTKDGIEFDGYCMKDFIGIDYLEKE